MTLIERLEQERNKCTKLSMDCEASVIQSCINIVRQHNAERLDINAPLLREKLEHKATKSIQLAKEMPIKDLDTLVGAMAAWVDICIQTTVEYAELRQYEQPPSEVNTTEDRVYIKENKRFSFLKSRFKLVGD